MDFEKLNIQLGDGSIENAKEKMLQYIQAMRGNGRLGIDGPHPELDKHTSGIIPGKVYTIAGYSNTGKSRFSYEYINHFCSMGLNVCVFSLEVDSGMLLQNLICNKEKKKYNEIDYEKFDYSIYDNLTIFDTKYDIKDIKSIIESHKPQIAVIDFIQNVQCGSLGEYERMARVARDIQQTAIVNNCTIFSISQLSNSTAKTVSEGNTDFITLKGAGELFASSDIIFVLRKIDERILGITIVKNKYGRKPDEMEIDCDFSTSTFTVNKPDELL